MNTIKGDISNIDPFTDATRPRPQKKTDRLVQVLHKCQDGPNPVLAVGKVFRFTGSGDAYKVHSSGALTRENGQPWKSKAERKQYLKARRLANQTS